MVKIKKKKKKKHEEQIKTMDKEVTIKTLLLQDEAKGWEKNIYRYVLAPSRRENKRDDTKATKGGKQMLPTTLW